LDLKAAAEWGSMATTEKTPRGSLQRDISRGLVALYKECTGRGPTRARTYVEPHLVVTLLHDTMTTTERTLAEEEEEDTIRDVRRTLQDKFRTDAVEIVERLTGRKVLAFLSDHAIDPDYAIEAFVLAPGLGEDNDRRDQAGT
jgi:uncharacterized protein YbcI